MQNKAKPEQVFILENQSYRIFHEQVPIMDRMPLHKHPVWEISHIIKGEGYRIVGDTLCRCNEGELLVIAPDIPHCWIFSEENDGWTENSTVQFRPETLDDMGHLAEFSSIVKLWNEDISECGGIVINEVETIERITGLMAGMDDAAGTKGLLTLMEIIGCIDTKSVYMPAIPDYPRNMRQVYAQRRNGSAEDRMTRIYLFILEHYHEAIKLSDIASVASMSESAFCSFFRRTARMSFSDFLTRFRMEKICSMLTADQSTPIAEIATSCGYSDIPHFNRTFRKYAGCTPGEFRKRTRHL